MKDEYGQIYGSMGFKLPYNGKRLGKSEPVPAGDILPGKANQDSIPMEIYCTPCGEYMDFTPGEGLLSGKWKCPVCGKSVREETAYRKLGQENTSFLMSYYE